jgi:hypothetical protein
VEVMAAAAAMEVEAEVATAVAATGAVGEAGEGRTREPLGHPSPPLFIAKKPLSIPPPCPDET